MKTSKNASALSLSIAMQKCLWQDSIQPICQKVKLNWSKTLKIEQLIAVLTTALKEVKKSQELFKKLNLRY